jgi:hypothetical protein
MSRVKVKLIELDINETNVFLLAGDVWKALNDADMPERAAEFVKKLSECRSDDEALALVNEYVEV